MADPGETKLAEHLTQEMIQLKVDADDWEAAVRAGGALLHRAGKCNQAYVEAMVKTVHEMGPYMVLAPGLAMAHARPQDGALALGISLITLNTPVAFGSQANDPVELVISFCAVDNQGHVDLLKALAMFLRDQNNQEALIKARTVDQVLRAIRSKSSEMRNE